MPPKTATLKQMIANISILILSALGLAYLGGMIFAYVNADPMIFPYVRELQGDPEGTIKLTTSQGDTISVLYRPASTPQASTSPANKQIVLYNHGNNTDLNALVTLLDDFQKRGLSIIAYDYPGYGSSSGRPSEAGVYAAAETVYQHLTETLGYQPDQITVYGCSLGSGPACWLAERYPIGRLILEGAFTSTFRVMTRIKLLHWDKFDNLARLPKVQCPVLLIHGRLDEVIPFSHALQNYQAIQSPKSTLWIESAGHNDVLEIGGEAYWNKILTFTETATVVKM